MHGSRHDPAVAIAVGNALGLPVQHHAPGSIPVYTGRVADAAKFRRKTGRVGQVSEPTELAVAIASEITTSRCYVRDAMIGRYIEWVKSNPEPLAAKGAWAIFCGVKTPGGFAARERGSQALPDPGWSRSSAGLARCAPLAALPEDRWEQAAILDCSITDPHPVSVVAVLAYLAALRSALAGAGRVAAVSAAAAQLEKLQAGRAFAPAHVREVAATLNAAIARDRVPAYVAPAGDAYPATSALYCAFHIISRPRASFREHLAELLFLGGDFVVNCAVTGTLLGALLGESALRADEVTGANLATVLGGDPAAGGAPRPAQYGARRIPGLARALAALA